LCPRTWPAASAPGQAPGSATSDVIGGLAPGIGVMLAARAVLGVCVGGFWVFGAGGTAVAVVSSGIFIATVASLPAGSLIGTLTTWRAAFAVAAVFAVIAMAAQLAAVPRLGAGGRVRPRSLLTVVTRPVSRIGLIAAGAMFFANFAAYTYIGPLLHARAGLGPAPSRWCCSGSAWPARPPTSPPASPCALTCGPR
jgi:predicted MFS family arabinose efflux permease